MKTLVVGDKSNSAHQGDVPPIRAVIPIRFAVLCAPDSRPDPDPIGRRFLPQFSPPLDRALRCLLDHRFATGKSGECYAMRAGGGRCGAGWGGMRRGNGESQNLAMLRMGRRMTRHPQLGAAGIPEVAHTFTYVNAFRDSELDFPRIPTVYVRKRQNRCRRLPRRHVGFCLLFIGTCARWGLLGQRLLAY